MGLAPVTQSEASQGEKSQHRCVNACLGTLMTARAGREPRRRTREPDRGGPTGRPRRHARSALSKADGERRPAVQHSELSAELLGGLGGMGGWGRPARERVFVDVQLGYCVVRRN